MVAGHAVAGALIQRAGGRYWWLLIPGIVYSHGLLDTLAIWHPLPLAFLTFAPVFFFYKYWRKLARFIPGAIVAYIPDIWDHGRRLVMGLPGHPEHYFGKWDFHTYLQRYPHWNWTGFKGQEWTMLIEVGFVLAGLCLLIWSERL